jgi:signal transduction histidine kinase
MPTLLHDLGFMAAIERCVQEFQKHTGIECSLVLPEEGVTPDDNQSSALFRTLQESLNNIAKHSHASKVSILFLDRDHSLIMLVKDNGIGFDMNTHNYNSFGLLSIKERARIVHGKARISSKSGKGTQVVFSIPLAKK